MDKTDKNIYEYLKSKLIELENDIDYKKARIKTIKAALQKKYLKKYRTKKCTVCKKNCDDITDTVIIYSIPPKNKNKYRELIFKPAHKKCKKKFKLPKGCEKY